MKNRDDFTKRLKKAFKAADLSVPAPLLKAILSALGARYRISIEEADSEAESTVFKRMAIA